MLESNNEPIHQEPLEDKEIRKQALVQLMQLDEELGLYDIDYTDNPLIRN